jgi:hypothetical protein
VLSEFKETSKTLKYLEENKKRALAMLNPKIKLVVVWREIPQ